MEENSIKDLEGIGQAEDSGFASLVGTSEVGKLIHNSIGENIKLSHQPLLDDAEVNRASKCSRGFESRRQLDEEYNKEKQELLYKRLKHLVTKSKFYSKVIVDKINNPIECPTSKQNNKRKIRQKFDETDEEKKYTPPVKKSRRLRNEYDKYNIKDYVSTTESNKIKKLNLSTDEIENELNTDSDEEEALNESEKVNIPLKYFTGELRDYQQVGLKWLISLYKNGLNGILGDEMGLGKTIQVIAMISYLIEKKQAGPFLIIVPLSTTSNWLSEFVRFSPELPVLFLHGPVKKTEAVHKKMKTMTKLSNDYKTLPIVLTTYEVALRDVVRLRKYNWRYIVVDEGQRLKNSNAQLSRAVRTLHSISRLILTGTPLQNDLSELWALLNFLMPDIFNDLSVFESWFDVAELLDTKQAQRFLKQEKEKQVIACLRDILKPFMLRREKDEVCRELPRKKEVLVSTPITELQRELYLAVIQYDYEYLAMIEKPSDIISDNPDGTRPKRKCTMKNKYSNTLSQSLTTSQTQSKKSNEASAEPVKSECQIDLPTWKQFTNIDDRNMDFYIRVRTGTRTPIYKQIISHPFLIRCPLDDAGLPAINETMVTASGKMLVLDKMLKKLHSRGHKVLLFSTMKRLLDLIADYLSLRPWKFVRLDGSVQLDKRNTNIEQFNNDPEIFIFLITTRAGGVGLNLAAADTVIMFDSDWNPQVDIQAMARCHRIGQTRPVVIYKFCSQGTIDEVIIKRAESKRKLEKMVISRELADLNLKKAETILELQKLLESTDYKIVESANDVFTEAELDALLDRSDLLVK